MKDTINELLELENKSGLYDIFKHLGGLEGMQRLVRRAYQYNSTDLRISHFFDQNLVDRFEKMFLKFLIGLLGGIPYNRSGMITAHQRFGGLKNEHFDAFIHNFTIAMMHENIGIDVVEKVCSLMERTREDVTGRTKLVVKSKPHWYTFSKSDKSDSAKSCPFCHHKLSAALVESNETKASSEYSSRSHVKNDSHHGKECNVM